MTDPTTPEPGRGDAPDRLPRPREADPRRTERHVHDEAEVDEASEESFPASDPPAWTPAVPGTGPTRGAP